MTFLARAQVAALGTAPRTADSPPFSRRSSWLSQAPLLMLTLVACSSGPDVVAREPSRQGDVHDPSNPPKVLDLRGDTELRDPTIAEVGGRFYLFHTGPGVSCKTSSDLTSWQTAPRVFEALPGWIAEMVPGVGSLWSPAVANFGGASHLYYAASNFGSDRSCIGHAAKPALDSSEPWLDRGSVVCSNTGTTTDDWNAIDPEIVLAAGTPWLVFGSFQTGIKLVRLDATGKRADSELHSIAMRTGATAAVQQPFLLRRANYYYLFSSFDACCMGIDSTRKVMVGRSADVLGPYFDRSGTPLLDGGGTLLLEGNESFRGPGSNAVLFHGKKSYNFYHAYDVNLNGRASLRIAELAWDDAGWPVSGGP